MTPGMNFTQGCEGTYDLCEYPHVPTEGSGVTWGFGYDCKLRSHEEIRADLVAAGVDFGIAEKFARASGLQGSEARAWLEQTGYNELKLTYEQMDALFETTYNEIAENAEYLYSKPGCRKKYGWILPWDALQQAIRDVIVDMRYRGDWTPATREWLAEPIRHNDLKSFAKYMRNEDYWVKERRVPRDRFRRWVAYLEKKT